MRNNDVPPILYIIVGIVFAAIIFFTANDAPNMKDRIILTAGLGTAVAAFFSLRGTRRKASCVSVIILLGIMLITVALLGGFK